MRNEIAINYSERIFSEEEMEKAETFLKFLKLMMMFFNKTRDSESTLRQNLEKFLLRNIIRI
jgi:hypothetical protein